MQETSTIWMNGEFVDWADAKVHVGVHGLHYGTGVFEGIRCYETPEGPAVFRLREHLQRLENSAKLLYMELPFAVEEIRTAIHELVGRNGLAECYLRPFAFYGYGELGVSTKGNPGRGRGHELAVGELPRRRERGHRHPLQDLVLEADRCEHDSARREGDRHLPQLDARGARGAERAGYDEAILLTDDGFVADGSGENIFVVKDGKIWTPPLSTSILPGITRDSVIQMAQDLGYVVEEASLIRSDLYLAEEIFMTGTAAEVMPVRSVDDHEIGAGPVTLELQKAYLDTVRGKSDRWGHWLDRVAVGDKTPQREA